MPDETFESFMSGRQKAPKIAEPKPVAVEDDSFSGFMESRQPSAPPPSRNTPANQAKLDENLFQYDFVNYARGKGLNDNPDAPENRATDYRKAWRENALPGLSRQPSTYPQTPSPRQQQPDNRSLVAVGHRSESSTTPPRPVAQQKRNQTTPASIRQNRPTATTQTDPFGRPTLGAQIETELADPNAGKVSPRVEAADRFREGLPPVFFPRIASAGGRFRRAAAEAIPRTVEGLAEGFETLGTIGGDPVASQPTGVAKAVRTVTRPVIQNIQRENPVDPSDQSFLTNKLPSALGSAAGMMATGALGRVARVPAILTSAGVGSGVEMSQVAEEADAAGISPEKRNAAIAMAGATGLTEALGIGRALDKFGLKQAFTRRAFQVLEEGGQEALQSYLGNINAALVGQYDPNRPLSQGVLESAVLGGLVGGTVQGASGLAARGQQRPTPQQPAPTAGLPDSILDRAIQNKRGAIPPTPQIATPREPLRRTGFDAMSPGQRRRAMQSGIGVEQGALPSAPGELAQRARVGGPRIPPATEPVQPQANPAQQVIQDYVAQVEQINQIADPAQKAEALNQARAEYRAKRAQVQQNIILSEPVTGRAQNPANPFAAQQNQVETGAGRPPSTAGGVQSGQTTTSSGRTLRTSAEMPQDIVSTPQVADQATFDADLAMLMEDTPDVDVRAAAIQRLTTSPLFPDAINQFNGLPAKQRGEILRQVPPDLRQAIKQFKPSAPAVTSEPQNQPQKATTPLQTPVEIPRANVENVVSGEAVRGESVSRNVSRATVEVPVREQVKPIVGVSVGRRVNVNNREVILTPEQAARWVAEVEPQERFIKERLQSDLKAGLGKLESDKRAKGSRMKLAALKREIAGQQTAKEKKLAETQARRDAIRQAKAQESVKPPVIEDQQIPPVQSPKVATIPKLPEAPQPPPVAASGQKKVAQFGNFSTERRPVPIATAENLESLRNRRAQLVEIQARRGADLNPDLQDEIRELGSSIKTFENQQLRGQPPMEAEEIGGTASGEQNAQYQPTPGDLRKVERMRSGPAKDLDPFIKALEANRNNDITGRREMGPEEKARNRYLLDRANAIRKERRKAEGLGPKNAPRETAMEPLSKVEGADLITKPVEEQRQVIEQRKAEYAAKKVKTVTHPDEAINGQPIIARTQDGRVIVPNEANKSGVSVVKDRADVVEIPEAAQVTEVSQPKVGDTVTVRFEGRDIRGELRGFDQNGRAKIREIGTGDDYTIPANRLNPAAKPQFVADAEVRLKDYASGKRAGSGGGQLADQAIVTGYNVYRAGMKFGEWSRRVIRELGNKVRPHLKAAWNQINERVSVGELPRTRADIENSPRFKKWFGESKIVDERGNPKIVYHSTQGDFDVFRDTSDIGFHFGTQKAANDRAETPTYFKNYGSQPFRDKSSIIPVYLSIKNPLKVGDVFSTSTDTLDRLIELGHIDANDTNFANIKTALRKGEIDSKEALRLRRTAMVTALEEQGYDGLEYTNMAEDAGSTSYVAFRPEQIKSATGNSGAFASSNASIMGSGFGSLQSAFEKRNQKKTSAAPAQTQPATQAKPQQRDLIAGLRRKGQPKDSSIPEKISTVRKAGFLGGIPTHAKNVLSNAIFQVSEAGARGPAALVDIGLSAATGRRSVPGWGAADVGAGLRGAKQGLKEAKDIIKSGQRIEDIRRSQRDESQFKNKYVKGYTEFIFRSLSAEDAIFRNIAQQRALEGLAKVQAINEARAKQIPRSQIRARQQELIDKPTPALTMQAIADAEVAVFQNKNRLSEAVAAGRKELSPGGKLAMDLFLPYDKTPTNIVLRMLDYSPAGLIRASGQAANATARGFRAARDRKAAIRGGALPDPGFKERVKLAIKDAIPQSEQKKFAETIGRSLTGTGAFLATGALLESMGLLTGFYGDKDEEKRNQELGKQPGSLLIGGRSYKIADFGPPGMLLVLGATMAREGTKPLKDEEKRYGNVYRATGKAIAESVPLFEAGKQASDVLTGEGNVPAKLGRLAAGFIPRVGNLSKAFDPYEREAGTFGTEIVKEIPIARNFLPRKQTVVGEDVEPGFVERGIGFIDPTSSRPLKENAALEELEAAGMGVGTSKRKEGESDEAFKARSRDTQKMFQDAAGKVRQRDQWATLTGAQKRKVLESLKARASRQVQLDEIERDSFALDPDTVIDAVLRSEEKKVEKERMRGLLVRP